MSLLVEAHELPLGAILFDARPPARRLATPVPGARGADVHGVHFATVTPQDRDRLRADAESLFAGVDDGRPLVAFDDGAGTGAARVAWLGALTGRAVGVLNGGAPALIAAGQLGADSREGEPVGKGAPPHVPDWSVLATGPEVAAGLNGGVTLLDARSPDEYLGVAGPPGTPRLGRIPGAVSFEWTRLFDAQGRWQPERLREVLPDSPGEIVVYCESGYRSSVLWSALRELGLPARNYVGSWWEWSRRQEWPVERDPG